MPLSKMVKKSKVIEERVALLEMYKAGFLDGYKVKNKLKKKEYLGIK